MTSADNLALASALTAPETIIRSLASLRIVDAEDTTDFVGRLEGAFKVDLTHTGDAFIDFALAVAPDPTADGIRLTCPRDGGTITAVDNGTTNLLQNLIQWPSEDGVWKNFACNITLDAESDWVMYVDPDGATTAVGRDATSPLIVRGLKLRRTA